VLTDSIRLPILMSGEFGKSPFSGQLLANQNARPSKTNYAYSLHLSSDISFVEHSEN
jgi:hypothetical protein